MEKEGLVCPAAALGRARLCIPGQQREEHNTGQLGTADLRVRQPVRLPKAQASISASAFLLPSRSVSVQSGQKGRNGGGVGRGGIEASCNPNFL